MNNIFSQNQILCLLSLASVALLGSNSSAFAQTANITSNNQASRNIVPIPGTVATTSAAFADSTAPTTATVRNQTAGNGTENNQSSSEKIAQADINPGRVTRGGYSYVGVAGNIGIGGGDSALGDGNFAVTSKIGLTRTISVRPSAVFSDNTAILIPITYDFPSNHQKIHSLNHYHLLPMLESVLPSKLVMMNQELVSWYLVVLIYL